MAICWSATREGVDIGTDVLINIQNVTGGAGNDTIIGDDNANVLNGGLGNDTITGNGGDDTINYTSAPASTSSTAAPTANGDTLAVSGTTGDDTIHVTTSGGVITSIEGMSPTNVENFTVDGLANGAAGDTLDYTGTTETVTVDLAANNATGFVVAGSPASRTSPAAVVTIRSPATAATTGSTAAPMAWSGTRCRAATATTPTSSTVPSTR